MRYPLIGGVQLGQVTDSDLIRLNNRLSSTLAAFNNSITEELRAEMASDMKICEDAASWARTTRNVQDLFDAEACLDIMSFDILNAQPVFTSEDPQPDVEGATPVPESAAPPRESRTLIGPWPWIGVGVGTLILASAVYFAVK